MSHRVKVKQQNLGYLFGGKPNWQWNVYCQERNCRFADYARNWELAMLMANYHGKYAK